MEEKTKKENLQITKKDGSTTQYSLMCANPPIMKVD